KKTIPHTVPGRFTIDETFDIGVDTRTSVDDNDYQPPFRFTGKLDKLTIKLGPTQLADTDRQKAAEVIATAHEARWFPPSPTWIADWLLYATRIANERRLCFGRLEAHINHEGHNQASTMKRSTII